MDNGMISLGLVGLRILTLEASRGEGRDPDGMGPSFG